MRQKTAGKKYNKLLVIYIMVAHIIDLLYIYLYIQGDFTILS